MGLIEFNLINFLAGIFVGIILGYALFLFKYGVIIGMYKTLKDRDYLDAEIERYLQACKEYNEPKKSN